MMNELKLAFQNATSYRRKLSILTVSPYGQDRTAEFFQASKYMVKMSRQLKKTHGVFSEPQPVPKGIHITDEDKSKVKDFFESDKVSRMCPGKSDFVVVRNPDGTKAKVQKRLVLGNLREIYASFKQDSTNPKIGFSSFAKLRPKNCVLAGGSGTHSVCVCTRHQNPKLITSALGLQGLTYHDLFDYAVCDANNRDCMMQNCMDCPGEKGVIMFLRHALGEESEDASDSDYDEELDSEVRYSQWVSTDRCTLKDIVETKEECMRTLSQQIVDLTKHHYISKHQSEYFSTLKATIENGEVVVQGDFSENYSFSVQDAPQGFYWESSQCSLHPFVAYWTENGASHHQSFCFVSDSIKHDTNMVHAFVKRLIPELRSLVPNMKKIYYFSDGCAAQYKNRKNFANVCCHEADFGIPCEWHFFATSHGKGACDGIGGTAKRAAYHESLRRPFSNQILTAEALFDYLDKKFVSVVKFIFVNSEEVKDIAAGLQERFASAVTVKGTQGFHKFAPVDVRTLTAHELSTDIGCRVKICK